MLRIDFNLVLTIINLIVLYLILRKFLFRPVMDIMEKREKMIADGIGHANEEQDKAHALKKQYEDANEKADKVMKTARESLNQEREQAFDDMKAQVAGLARDAAKKILLENADNISGVNAYDQFLKDAGDSHDSEE